MPISYDIDVAARIVTATLTGDLTRDDFANYFRASSADPRFRTDMHRLVIAADVTGFPSADEVSTVAKSIRERITDEDVRFAVVASSPLAVGMANMFLIQAGLGERFELFADRVTGLYWLLTGKTQAVSYEG